MTTPNDDSVDSLIAALRKSRLEAEAKAPNFFERIAAGVALIGLAWLCIAFIVHVIYPHPWTLLLL